MAIIESGPQGVAVIDRPTVDRHNTHVNLGRIVNTWFGGNPNFTIVSKPEDGFTEVTWSDEDSNGLRAEMLEEVFCRNHPEFRDEALRKDEQPSPTLFELDDERIIGA